jgi:hypothetical protein
MTKPCGNVLHSGDTHRIHPTNMTGAPKWTRVRSSRPSFMKFAPIGVGGGRAWGGRNFKYLLLARCQMLLRRLYDAFNRVQIELFKGGWEGGEIGNFQVRARTPKPPAASGSLCNIEKFASRTGAHGTRIRKLCTESFRNQVATSTFRPPKFDFTSNSGGGGAMQMAQQQLIF